MRDEYIKIVYDHLLLNTMIDDSVRKIHYPNDDIWSYLPTQVNSLGRDVLIDLNEVYGCTSEEAETILGLYLIYLSENLEDVKHYLEIEYEK